jgi:RNA polymerase sigma-70 factor (ECF subfamily)
MAFSWPAPRHAREKWGVGALNPPARWGRAIWVALRRHLLLGQSADASSALAPSEVFDNLFERHERQIFGYLWRMTSDHALASDLCQETFLRAWQRLDRVSTYENPLGWLLRVATNLAIDAQRGQRRLLLLTGPLDEDNEPVGSDPTGGVADRELVAQILQSLAPRARAALVLREVYGLSLDEVAQTIGSTSVATKKTLSRAREQFRVAYLREDG